MNKDAKIIIERVKVLFKRIPNTKYTINVANDIYDKQYNFFLESQKKGQRPRSVPLHSITNYDLENLENIINEIKKVYKLSIEYTGFTDQRWPSSWRVIQKKRKLHE
ncbi:acetyl-CoA carboxylase [Pediococcus acidilactici]|uniref:acetyl-CoA carboxylase n=1 Tax=Pediococcus acidilactici TaxID=1254 RepID=UPI001324BBAC|nr:acetyl-CoA carboxylase [Pediococcus acidilactici]KAF0343792.1 acetyl-CoA carboxylase [Pediococcus acidilactici]KAF0353611.1 acetyl-CoA carboxylase [Pediococcus acidilactici]KAF0357947.1 acetyl-CoA carboxylase [Pediococcus acidilactici]KAF0362109.1 acetyl-CoA carboxylase [Pediococcus acidilactici]KAF0408634.1 acetyl-CoA carboxylase [Pediococcus acidilactici]